MASSGRIPIALRRGRFATVIWACAAIGTAALALSASAGADDIRCRAENGHPKATVLVLHPGGWGLGSAGGWTGPPYGFAKAGFGSVRGGHPPFDHFRS